MGYWTNYYKVMGCCAERYGGYCFLEGRKIVFLIYQLQLFY